MGGSGEVRISARLSSRGPPADPRMIPRKTPQSGRSAGVIRYERHPPGQVAIAKAAIRAAMLFFLGIQISGVVFALLLFVHHRVR